MNTNNQNPSTEGKLLRANDVARILNISRAMAYRLIQQGKIRHVRINSARRVRLADLNHYIEANSFPYVDWN